METQPTAPLYNLHSEVFFEGNAARVTEIRRDAQGYIYRIELAQAPLSMWIPETLLTVSAPTASANSFNVHSPHMTIVDGFLRDPDAIRALAIRQSYVSDARYYKGQRTQERYLWAGLREEFERLLHLKITDWLNQPMNGVFQITGYNDPLVWHHDSQDYAAALYLTKDAPLLAGTSFWQLKTTGNRRPASHALERDRFVDDQARAAADAQLYDMKNITSGDNWELCDRVGAVYNRLVLWDAKMIHSASSYEGMAGGTASQSRLVQLFFFSVK
jgi:Family of unknown function (DUF6445)